MGGGAAWPRGGGQLATTEIYDPTNNSFTPAASLNTARTNACAATLKDGRVLVVGNWFNPAGNAEIYDPSANTFTVTGACLKERSYPVIIPTDDGGAIVCGGTGVYGDRIPNDVFEKYDPVANSFTSLTATLFDGETSWDIGCFQPTLTQQFKMANGKYVVMVYKTDYSMLRLISIDPTTLEIKEITTQSPIPLVDTDNQSITYSCNRTPMIDVSKNLIHIVQAAQNTNYILRIVTINPVTGSVNYSKMNNFDYSPISSNISMLSDGRILFTGGNKPDNFTLSSRAFIVTPATYNQSDMSITNLPDLTLARAGHAQIVPTPTKYVVIGGHVNGFLLTQSVEIYKNSWQSAVSADNRDMPFVAQLNNGKYLLGGGASSAWGVGQLSTTEIYDPVTDSFTPAASLNVARVNASAATLKDGRILVVGNWYNSAGYAEVYDPSTNTFTLTGACLEGRACPVIIPTNDGGAIVCGGIGIYGDRITNDVFEKYNPVSNGFTTLTSTLFNGETSWDIGCYQPTLTQQYRMANGKYVVIVYKTDYSLVRIISIDPATLEIKEITTQSPIPLVDTDDPSITYSCNRTPMIDVTNNLIHIVQQAQSTSYILRIVTINLTTGSVNTAKMSGFDYSVSSSALTMLNNGSILFTGGNKPDNFVLSPRAFIITPATFLETSVNNTHINNITVRWDQSSQAFLFSEEVSDANLYNITGSEIMNSGRTNILSASSIPSGVYFIRINRSNPETSRFIKVIKP